MWYRGTWPDWSIHWLGVAEVEGGNLHANPALKAGKGSHLCNSLGLPELLLPGNCHFFNQFFRLLQLVLQLRRLHRLKVTKHFSTLISHKAPPTHLHRPSLTSASVSWSLSFSTSSLSSLMILALGSSLTTAWLTILFARSAYRRVDRVSS